jgi:2-hydroxycyclohexanecarboxyl-CoA dehydrogenase
VEKLMADGVDYTWRQATNLSGQRVLLTGCASGIGRATAELYAQAGAIVYGGDVNVEAGESVLAGIRAQGGKAEFLRLDLTKAESIDAFVDAVRDKAGGTVDIVASIAGVDVIKPFLKNEPASWNLIINVNYLGPVRMIHRLLPSMVEAGGGGKIVTVASDAGRVGSSGETFYAGSKGAVIAFTKSLAREMARYRINCNCVAPGPTATPLFLDATEQKLQDALTNAIPFKRLARPSEIAHTILYFSSPAADYITGQVLSVSGGLTMHG